MEIANMSRFYSRQCLFNVTKCRAKCVKVQHAAREKNLPAEACDQQRRKHCRGLN